VTDQQRNQAIAKATGGFSIETAGTGCRKSLTELSQFLVFFVA